MTDLEDNNLFSFYFELAQYEFIECVLDVNYSWIQAKYSDWPKYVYDVDLQKHVRNEIVFEVANKMKNEEIPPFLILNECSIDRDFENLLEKMNLRKIDRWPVLTLSTKSFRLQENYTSQFQSTIVNTQKELMQWFSIIKEVLFLKKNIEFELFNHLFAKHNFVFILGFLNHIPVSTAMLYIKDGFAGIYMVATIEKYRGQGFGRKITEFAIEKAKNLNQNYVTLQSSRMGFPLYTKIGFSFLHNLNVYWMI